MNIQEGVPNAQRNEALQMARNMSQMELANELGQDPISWINTYAEDFGKIISSNPSILDRLSEEGTHSEALDEVRKELYH